MGEKLKKKKKFSSSFIFKNVKIEYNSHINVKSSTKSLLICTEGKFFYFYRLHIDDDFFFLTNM